MKKDGEYSELMVAPVSLWGEEDVEVEDGFSYKLRIIGNERKHNTGRRRSPEENVSRNEGKYLENCEERRMQGERVVKFKPLQSIVSSGLGGGRTLKKKAVDEVEG